MALSTERMRRFVGPVVGNRSWTTSLACSWSQAGVTQGETSGISRRAHVSGQNVRVDDPDGGDWHQAEFHSLESEDPALADELASRLVNRFLAAADLSIAHRTDALRQVVVQVGKTPQGVGILRVRLPLGEGDPSYEWDGSHEAARQIIDSMADVAAETISGSGFPTGWEPDRE